MAVLAFCAVAFLSPPKAFSSPAPGLGIIDYARSQVGQGAEANTCEVFAEQALKAANDGIPPQEGASQAWTFFQTNWQQYAPCQPQSWDASKAQAGDLVFWAAGQAGSTCDKTYGHVAVYDGNGGLIENAGRGITNDHSVNYPCTGSPTGFVPMTSCNGSPNSANGTYTMNGNTYSSFPQQNQSSMAALMPMMMMSSMMSSMMSPMMSAMQSAMSGLGSGSNGSGSGSTSSGTTSTGSTSGTTGTTSTGSAASTNSTGSAAAATGTTTAGASTASASAAAAATTGASATATGTTVSSLLTLIQNLLDNSGTAATTPATQASTDVEQVDQQAADETANAGPATTASLDSAQTNNVPAIPDPTQDYHPQGGHSDHRLSCAYTAGASVANCRSATGASQ